MSRAAEATTIQRRGAAHAYQRLLDMGTDRMQQLDGMIAKGEPSLMIVDIIQNEWQQCRDIQRSSLARQVNRYRNTVIVPRMAVMYETSANKESTKATEVFFQQLNMLEEMSDLFETQKVRVVKALKVEADMPLPLKDTTVEIDLLRKMGVDLSNLHLEMGLIRRAPKQIQGAVQNPDGSKSSFHYVVEQEQVESFRRRSQQFIDFLDSELLQHDGEDSVSADPADTEHARSRSR
jgi:hypothetical protein